MVEVQGTSLKLGVRSMTSLHLSFVRELISGFLMRSENTLIGATNDETERVNSAIDFKTGEEGTIPEVAKKYKARGQPWMIVTDVSSHLLLNTKNGN